MIVKFLYRQAIATLFSPLADADDGFMRVSYETKGFMGNPIVSEAAFLTLAHLQCL